MPTETKEVSAKADLLKESQGLIDNLLKLRIDVQAQVLQAQGQAGLAESIRVSLEWMSHLLNDLNAMPDSAFAMIPDPAKAPEGKGTPDAKGHQSGQHVRGPEEKRV